MDFLFLKEGKIIPVEVKSGSTETLRSLHLFLESRPNSPYGLKISEADMINYGKISALPFYSIRGWLNAE